MRSEADQQPLDLAHLDAQTGGDETLAREVLHLFLDRSPADLARLKAASGNLRREAAHLIVGSARAIGAAEVATAAAAVEAGDADIARLETAIAEARRFIAAYLEA